MTKYQSANHERSEAYQNYLDELRMLDDGCGCWTVSPVPPEDPEPPVGAVLQDEPRGPDPNELDAAAATESEAVDSSKMVWLFGENRGVIIKIVEIVAATVAIASAFVVKTA